MSVDKSPRRVRQMFAEIAARYDLLNRLLSAGIDRRWRRRTVRMVPPSAGVPVLDLCTGTADLALAYWRAGRGEVPVIGADFCHPMLVLGQEKCRRAQAAIGLIEADAQALPFADDSFQIVSIAFGLRNLSDPQRGLCEMVRVCRPGGRVAVLEFSLPRGKLLRAAYGWYFRHVLPRVGQALARNRQAAYNYLPASVGQFPQGEALARHMEQAGLHAVEHRAMTFGIATLYVGTK